jgi:hypothetical protein
MSEHSFDFNRGTIAPGTGKVITQTATGWTTVAAQSPLLLSSGNHIVLDNQANQFILTGNGDNYIAEYGVNAFIALGDGNSTIYDPAAGANILVGHGNSTMILTGGDATVVMDVGNPSTGHVPRHVVSVGGDRNNIEIGDGNNLIHAVGNTMTLCMGFGIDTFDVRGDHNTIMAGVPMGAGVNTGQVTTYSVDVKGNNNTVDLGDGNATVHSTGNFMTLSMGAGNDKFDSSGMGNNIATGAGTNTIALDRDGSGDCGRVAITANTLHLGNGSNTVFLGGSGDKIFDGTGNDNITVLHGAGTVEDLNALGGTETVLGFNIVNGMTLDLTDILAGIATSGIAGHLALTSHTDPQHGGWTDNVLTVSGLHGTATVTLLKSGHLTIPSLLGSSHVIA